MKYQRGENMWKLTVSLGKVIVYEADFEIYAFAVKTALNVTNHFDGMYHCEITKK